MDSEPIAQKARWAIGSEAMRARGRIVLVKSNKNKNKPAKNIIEHLFS